MKRTLVSLLSDKGLTLSVAESCTGGLIGHLITNIPGSSSCFMGGIISYSNQAKCDLLGVREETIFKYGAVSSQTAEEMAEGVRKRFKTLLSLSVTGIAGPEGGSGEKPVGTVYMGLSDEKCSRSFRYLFHGSRGEIKQKTAEAAIENFRRYLNGDSLLPGI